MIDQRIEMVRPDLAGLPDPAPPPGYTLRAFRPGDEAAWTAVVRAAETQFAVGDGLFAEQYGHDLPGACERVLFLVDEVTGEPAATSTAWYGDNRCGDRAGWGRVHWVAALPSHQGRGLGAAVVTATLALLADLGHDRVYLVTSTARPAALRLYARLGFVPDLSCEGSEEAWRVALAQCPGLGDLLPPGTIPL
jgi:mycothiol synthase